VCARRLRCGNRKDHSPPPPGPLRSGNAASCFVH
jgi:hypothetical protein